MVNLISPLGWLLASLVMWLIAFDVAENFDDLFLNLILFGTALSLLVGFMYDAIDLFKSGVNSDIVD